MASDESTRPEGAEEAPLQVHLPAFDGPLDLLLHLIRKNRINIYDIPIAQITDEYGRTLDLMRELDLEVAGEFVYMAALLIHIKSKMLLPRRGEPGAEEEDPRQELVDRLLEFRRVKQIAESLHQLEAVERAVWTRPRSDDGPPDSEVSLAECSLFDLVDCFEKVLERFRLSHPPDLEVPLQRFSVKEKMIQILARLEQESPARLLSLLSEVPSRAEVIVLFIATLELVRLGIVRAFQEDAFGEILLHRAEAAVDLERFEDVYQ